MRTVTFLLFASIVVPARAGDAQTVILRVVDRGQKDAAVAGADVRVRDSKGQKIHESVTNGDGEVSFGGQLNRALTIEYEKLGYIRRPETLTVMVHRGNNRVEGALVRTGADRSYYAQVGIQINELLQMATGPERERISKEELDRVRALSQPVREAVLAGISTRPTTSASASPAATPPRALPRTASRVPYVGIAGLAFLVAGWVLTVRRSRAAR